MMTKKEQRKKIVTAALTRHRCKWLVEDDEERYSASCYQERRCQQVQESQQQDI